MANNIMPESNVYASAINSALANMTSPTTISMTSKEIAEMVGSQHGNVKISIERLAKRGVIQLPAMQKVEDKQSLSANNKTEVYIFSGEQGKRDSIVVVAQLSPEFTARLVDRWRELEAAVISGRVSQPQSNAITVIEIQERKVDLAERILNIAQRIGDYQLEVMAVDSIKNVLLLDAPGSTSNAVKTEFFQTHEVLESLGFSQKEIRSKGSSAGRVLAQTYRIQTNQEPKETVRIVDGAKRTVKVYPMTWFESAKLALSQHYS